MEIEKEDIAQTITDEVGKPITFARIEVERAIETVKLSVYAMVNLEGHTINTDAMMSGKKLWLIILESLLVL